MFIKTEQTFKASLDDGLTVTTFGLGEHDVPDWVGEYAIKNHEAKKIKQLSKADPEEETEG